MVAWAAVWLVNAPANAASVDTILPPYTDTIDGVPAAFWFDDFVSYQNNLLFQLQALGFSTSSGLNLADLGDYSGTGTGSGNLDLLLYTGSGVDNDPVAGGLTFEDPVPTPAGSGDYLDSDNWWGLDDLANDGATDDRNGPVTVGQVLEYLHLFNPQNNIPMFVFDNNQTQNPGADDPVEWGYAAGEVLIVDSLTGAIEHSWALDALSGPQPGLLFPGLTGPGDDIFNEPTNFEDPVLDSAWAPVPNTLTFVGDSDTYVVDNNRGSGSNEFYVYAPSMDLSAFDPTDLFVTHVYFANNTDGYHEVYLTGRIAPYVIPEPATLGLGLVALAGVGAAAWRRRRTRDALLRSGR